MLVNVDASALFVKDRASLVEALAITPEYLKNAASQADDVIDYRDWQVPLARRFRALKLWYVVRSYGAAGLQRHVREHVRLARELARWIEEDEDFELAAPPSLSLVCFRHRDGDAFNERLLEQLNASGAMYLSHTRFDGRYTLRFAIGHARTRESHVADAWSRIRAAARLERISMRSVG
jgi:aromatic-L-amino-acid decarboxylase